MQVLCQHRMHWSNASVEFVRVNIIIGGKLKTLLTFLLIDLSEIFDTF